MRSNSLVAQVGIVVGIVLLAGHAMAGDATTQDGPQTRPAAAANPPAGAWTLKTDDTHLELTVRDGKPFITVLKNPAQGWNWTPDAAPVPMPTPAGKMNLRWEFRGVTETKTNGYELTLRFTSAGPALELTSVWRALPGPGPVENEVRVVNNSEGTISFSKDLAAARIMLAADAAVTLHRAEKTAVGKGRVYLDEITASKTYTTHSGIIPLIILQSGPKHGAYFGFEWELGGFMVGSQADPLRLEVACQPVTENATRGKGEEFLVPSVYYGVYQGDMDDGANRFKRWFWKHKITRSLHDNADEPWVEVCMQDLGGNGSSSVTGTTLQSTYDRLADTGVECVKHDYWDGTGQCWYTGRDWQFKPAVWPNGFDFARKAHQAGLMSMFTRTARSLRSTLDNIATPSCVKAYGRNPPRLRREGITFCDTKASASSAVS